MSRILFFIVFFFTFVIQNSYAEILKEVKVIGNKRISKETIILFSNIKINEDLNIEELDDILKKLYETNFFSDVKVNFEQNILEITLVENPIIQNVVFEEGKVFSTLVDQEIDFVLEANRSSDFKVQIFNLNGNFIDFADQSSTNKWISN